MKLLSMMYKYLVLIVSKSMHYLIGGAFVVIGAIGLVLPVIPGLLFLFLGFSLMGFKPSQRWFKQLYERYKNKKR